MNTIEVTNPNGKLALYFGQPLKVKKHGPSLATFRLPQGWSCVVPPTKNNFDDDIHAIGPAGATPCPHCGREEDGKWFTPCPSDDCPSHELSRPPQAE